VQIRRKCKHCLDFWTLSCSAHSLLTYCSL